MAAHPAPQPGEALLNAVRFDDKGLVPAVVQQTGVACHTGRMSCWFMTVRDGKLVALNEPEVDPQIMASESAH